ncbi:MAG TPA: hypothetical protein VH044_14530 [Polyangiaceae bacterium]|jgi:hypothetical protein|nr:hypothetical protein [Polyangiaceae bacterium]
MIRLRRAAASRATATTGTLGGLALGVSLLACLLTCGCGYRAVYGSIREPPLHVKLVRTLIPDVVASDEVATGLREELAREGTLAAGEGFPRIEVEVLRADESSEGIAAGPGGPVARGTDVGIAARAWIVRAPGAPPESDTGDLRAEETIAVDETTGSAGTEPDPRASAFHEADALRAAARRLGRRLAYKVTGQPAASDDVNQRERE